MYIESSLPCVEFFTVSTGALWKEIRGMKEDQREMLWLKDLFSLITRFWQNKCWNTDTCWFVSNGSNSAVSHKLWWVVSEKTYGNKWQKNTASDTVASPHCSCSSRYPAILSVEGVSGNQNKRSGPWFWPCYWLAVWGKAYKLIILLA